MASEDYEPADYDYWGEWPGYPFGDDDDDSEVWWNDEPNEPFDDPYFHGYPEEPFVFERWLCDKFSRLIWRIQYFWWYKLNMRRCYECGKIMRFGNHNICNSEDRIPF